MHVHACIRHPGQAALAVLGATAERRCLLRAVPLAQEAQAVLAFLAETAALAPRAGQVEREDRASLREW